jgi:uncharacterized protein DUF5985
MGVEAVIYLLCFFSSGLCAYLLNRSFSRSRERLLLWSAICFALLSVNNLLVFIDIILLPEIDLTLLRSLASLAAVATLLYGFIWEMDR